ncbi:MAG: MFS transporter [Rhodospirillales bacterium]|nr:MFS transporter [Rhodospirillales bacterium]
MANEEPGPASVAALRNAVLRGHEPPPLPAVAKLPWYPWAVVGTVCIGAFMGQVDASLTQMLLPRLEHDFHAPLSTVSWVAVAYILTMASFMPIFGRLADMVGRKLLYTSAFLIFVIGSGLCGFAPDLPTLIVFRIVQGIGAALLTANSIAVIVLAVGPEHRGRALGLQSAAQAIGLGVGPAVGGLVLDTLGWNWAFWINVPFGLLGLLLGWFVLPQTRHLQGGGRFDWHGAFLIAPALTAVVALLNEGHTWGVGSPAFISCVVAAIVLLVLFVRAERRAETPLIDFTLLRQQAFLTGNLANFLSYATLFGVFFLIPFVLVRIYQDSELVAGLRLSIVPVMLGLLAPVGGGLYDRFGARVATASGMALCVAGLAVLYLFLDGNAANMPLVMLALAIFGIGQGLFISPNSSAIMATAPEELTGEAGSLLNVVRYLGISTGIVGASTVLALGLAAAPGSNGITVDASAEMLVFASRLVILMLGVLGILAGALSLMRTVPRKARGEHAVEL